MKFGIEKFSRALIANLISDFQNQKWRSKFKKIVNSCMSIDIREFLKSQITNLRPDFQNFKWIQYISQNF